MRRPRALAAAAAAVLALAAVLAVRARADVAAASGAPAPPAAPTAPAGFDHDRHGARVAAAGADPIACTACHAWRGGALAGKPGHAACFTGCHGGAPRPPARGARHELAPERLRVCAACHAEATLRAPYAGPAAYAVAYPPYRAAPDHALQLGHRTHGAIACAQCHAGPRGAPHRRCDGCHDGTGAPGRGPAMTACARCHAPAAGGPGAPRLLRTSQTQIVVTSAFSHARHAARGGAGRACATCHAPIPETDDRELPRPTAEGCAIGACHDGKAAFPITAACTRCHRDVPTARFEVARPERRFSHAAHAGLPGAPAACTACHPVARNGEVLVAGHAACAACHADDFGARQPKICGACHNATEPWRALVPDRLPPDDTEFGATIDHGKHPGPCTSCHALTTATAQLRPPRGHVACTGGACHAVSAGPAPRMTACESCHAAGRAVARRRARLAAPWSVRAAFDHAPHRRGKDGEVPCTACHTDLSAPDLASLRTPAKATCAGCHDGATSFKLTGTGCARCHGRGAGTGGAPAGAAR